MYIKMALKVIVITVLDKYNLCYVNNRTMLWYQKQANHRNQINW